MKALGTNESPVLERHFDHDLCTENAYSTIVFSGPKAFNILVVVKGVCACMGTDNGRAVLTAILQRPNPTPLRLEGYTWRLMDDEGSA